MLSIEAFDQCFCLCDVITVTRCESKSQWIAQAINAYMDFGAEPASTPAQCLGDLAPLF